ncbi:CPBP family intramembrane glutamic endopeptidase [Pediococcus claussenii]|uniref:CAAX amino terminal protease self-immunity family protein n=1 Tax=Pediococcus claussenii (strain ATCC BAA-344 / DSM 14800 / JCM 18046 / KCTC 3811 / LMG 21948 / P06) TaxID=701521 RepID=G8PB03_PEDCP|nr:type II CAAX endopeptidase family protein [Pediococcus claussenii]AEV95871.1 CAAX amino terminal protease self- immunity family protein [Pediococcus claussenii ATCC BAA-344]ANZ69366.1 hypothetical protein AYR57_03175 [Pediococcus claussenii]KRN20478.1 hypothetical protein IV79_GL000533 [Pediococcus claussenii]
MKKGAWGSIFVTWIVALIAVILLSLVGGSSIRPTSWMVILIRELILIAIAYWLNKNWVGEKVLFDSTVSIKTVFVLNIPTWFLLISAISNVVAGSGHIDRIPLALAVGIGAGVFEEYLFRGVILRGILKLSSGPHQVWNAVLISSFMFGVSHMVNIGHQALEPTVVQGASAMILGLFLAALYLRTKNIIWPMLFHGLNDFGAVYVIGSASCTSNLDPTRLIGEFIVLGGLAIIFLRKSQRSKILDPDYFH